MTVFQLIFVPITVVLALWCIRGAIRNRALGFAVLALVWIAAAVSIAQPNLTTKVARLLGVRRGADLLIYAVALFSLFSHVVMALRVRSLSRDVVVLTRELALAKAREGDDSHQRESQQGTASS